MAKTRDEFQVAIRPKRIKTKTEIIANIIMWASPLIMALAAFFINFETVSQAPTKVKVEFWMILILIGVMLFYSTKGKKALNDAIQLKKANAEKITPLLALADGICALIPLIIGIMALDFLKFINEPIENFLIFLLIFQAVGRLLLFFDSFTEAKYE